MVIQEDEADDLLESVDRGLKQLRYGAVSLLQVEADMPRRVLDILIDNFEVDHDVVVRTSARMGLGDWNQLLALHRPTLKDPVFHPRTLWPPDEADLVFEQIADQDFLVHHPFDSFTSVETFLKAAIADPQVVAIKITLYRIGADSPLVDLLIQAAEQGKQVAVLVELKARFDERNNIAWATRLESAGIHVVYGLVNIKVHCKLCLVVRKETGGIRRYAHLATGNYNRTTSRIYTDIGLFTADEAIVDDVSEVFNTLTGYSNKRSYRALLVAPSGLRPGIRALIEREVEHAKAGRPAGHRHQEQRGRRPGDHQDALPGLAGRRAHRPHRARRLLPAPGRARLQREHPRAVDRRPPARALASLLVRERRRTRALHRQRRPDGAQPRPARRGAGAGHRRRAPRRICARSCSARCSRTPRAPGCSRPTAATSAPSQGPSRSIRRRRSSTGIRPAPATTRNCNGACHRYNFPRCSLCNIAGGRARSRRHGASRKPAIALARIGVRARSQILQRHEL